MFLHSYGLNRRIMTLIIGRIHGLTNYSGVIATVGGPEHSTQLCLCMARPTSSSLSLTRCEKRLDQLPRGTADPGKAIMSYACGRQNDNVFFEPVDVGPILAEYVTSSARGFFRDLRRPPGADAAVAAAVAARPQQAAAKRWTVPWIVTMQKIAH